MDFPTFCSNNRLLLRRTSAASVAKERHSEGMRLVHSKLIDFYQYFFSRASTKLIPQDWSTSFNITTLFPGQHQELGEVKTSPSTSTYMHHPIMMVVLELLILQRVNLKMSNLLLKINKGSINLC